MGDCVGGIVIFNRNRYQGADHYPKEVDNFSEIINEYCPTKSDYYNSYILILPWKTLMQDAKKSSSWWDAIKRTFTWKYYSDLYKQTVQTVRLIKPSCIGLQGEFSEPFYYIPKELSNGPQNLNEKNLAMCYSLSKTDYSTKPATSTIGYEYVMTYIKTLDKAEDECLSSGGQFGGGGTSGTY
jgi:hypothetical protein